MKKTQLLTCIWRYLVSWPITKAFICKKVVPSIIFWLCVSISSVFILIFMLSAFPQDFIKSNPITDLTTFYDKRLPSLFLLSVILICITSTISLAISRAQSMKEILCLFIDEAVGQIVGLGSLFIASSLLLLSNQSEAGKITNLLSTGGMLWAISFIFYWVACRHFPFLVSAHEPYETKKTCCTSYKNSPLDCDI